MKITEKINIILRKLGRYFQTWQDWIKKRRWVQIAINTALILFMVVYITSYIRRDWQEVVKTELSFDINAVWITFGLYAINFFLLIAAWHGLIKCYGGSKDLRQNALLYCYSSLYKFLPTPAWFLASRVYLYSQAGMRKRVILSTTALETLLQVITGLIVFCLSFIDSQRPITWLYALVIIPALIALNKPHWFEMRWINGENPEFILPKKDLIRLVVCFTLTWIIAGPFFFELIHIVSRTVPMTFNEILQVWILSSMIGIVSAYTLGGLGIFREISLAFLLSGYLGVPLALIVSILVRLIITLGGILFALLTIGVLKLPFGLQKNIT
jgi:glycosyltransferase 2 family protein